MSHTLAAAHLGDLGAALVDDQLDPATRDLALAHLAGCAGCRVDVDQQRQLKARLRGLGEPGLPGNLVIRLSALNRVGEVPPTGRPVLPPPTHRDRPSAAVMDAGRPDGPGHRDGHPQGRSSLLRDSRRGRRLLVGAASVLLFGGGTAYAAAGDARPGSPSRPASDVLTTSGTASVTTTVSLTDPAFDAMTAAFSH